MREGLPLPNRMQNAPELTLGLGIYYNAFTNLSTSRPLGMAEGPIPWHIIEQYCEKLQLSPEQNDDMHFLIREMDGAYLGYRERNRSGK